MKEENHTAPAAGIGVLDYLIFLAKWKKLLLLVTALFVVGAGALALFIPARYRGEAKVLVSQQGGQNVSLQLMSQIGAMMLPAGGAPRTNSDLCAALLKSRTVLDRVVKSFDLMQLYQVSSPEKARRKLLKALSVQDQKKSGLLLISVEDRDPKRAALLADQFVEELKRMSRNLAVTEAGQRRLFFEEQLGKTKEALTAAEESLKGYQERTGAVEMKEQAKAVIETIAQTRAQIAAKEVELKVLRSYATRQNPDMQRTEDQLRGMKEQLARFETRDDAGAQLLMPGGSLPQAGTGYTRKVRELKYTEALYELLLKQYQAARIDEAKDAMVIQVVEGALPPEKRERPHRGFILFGGAFLGAFFALIAALLLEYREKLAGDPAQRERVLLLKRYAWGKGERGDAH